MTRSSGPTTFGVRPSPACLLCGIVILDNSDLERAGLRVLLKEDQWKFPGCKGRRQHIMASASEIENKEFIMKPELSSCYFRADITSQELDPKQSLSSQEINQVEDKPLYIICQEMLALHGSVEVLL
ncbi:hypothetical protein N7528_005452 [Penicillium herquei]|nr:hypothetical protein N7528_005452 [Penicillium herquei]